MAKIKIISVIRLQDKSSSGGGGGGGGLMRGIKIPQQDFALKMPGGLMREGGCICGTLRYYCECKQKSNNS